VYSGCGVHHVAIGVNDFQKTRAFYASVLKFDNIFVDFPDAEYPALTEVVRWLKPRYRAILFSHSSGGIITELVRMSNPVPRPIRKDVRYGDLGVAKLTIAVDDVERLYGELTGTISFCSASKSVSIPGWGEYRFVFCKDPEGNLIEFASGAGTTEKNEFGGVRSVGVSVSDLDRSVHFYRKYGGFDRTIIEVHEAYSGLVDEISGGKNTQVRSCLLGNSEADGFVELFEVSAPRGRSIPFGVAWGDFGFLQVCLNGRQGDDVFQMAANFEEEGMEFICTPQLMGDERQGAFFYGKDPDGIPVEFLVFLK
jgi:catechol 2,3-dioxygenase-like lactoylglutathione lyase family enzyme